MNLSEVRAYHVSVLWLFAVVMGVVCVGLAISVDQGVEIVAVDHRIASLSQQSVPSSVLWFLSLFTYLGDRHFLTGFAVALIGALLFQRAWGEGMLGVFVMAGSGGLTTLIKHLIQRVRPEHVHGYVYESGWSFPSGHSSASMAVYGFTCYIVLRRLPHAWHAWCICGAVLLVLGIGFSRILLQVHYVSDVIAGFALSLSWSAFCLGVYVLVLRLNRK